MAAILIIISLLIGISIGILIAKKMVIVKQRELIEQYEALKQSTAETILEVEAQLAFNMNKTVVVKMARKTLMKLALTLKGVKV